jgi:cystathionine beta-lyase family protein involved in aluminum resistance
VCDGGIIRLRANCATVNIYSGVVYLEEAATSTTVNIYGGRLVHNSTGTVTTVNVYAGGTADWQQSSSARTVTNLNIYRDSTVLLNKAAVTYTNAPVLQDTMTITTATPA